MTRLRLLAALFIALAALLAACGSDSSGSGGGSTSGANADAKTEADAPAASDDPASGSGDVDGPCSLATQADVASVFPGAGSGKPGQVRNCEFRFASGAVQAVNVYLYEDTTLAEFKKQAKDNDFTITPVDLGDGAIRDQLHTLTVQQGDTLFSVQALPRDGITETKLAPFDPQVLALAKKIAADL